MYDNWHTLTLDEQLGNAGSDYERALRWKAKGQQALFENAFARTLEQIDLTLADERWAGARRREIARAREEVCREILYEDNASSAAELQRYFLAFATAARRQVG
ncbi:MAG: hypothetical protein WEC84_04790 [Candidatus Andersenbacteria bacterium]